MTFRFALALSIDAFIFTFGSCLDYGTFCTFSYLRMLTLNTTFPNLLRLSIVNPFVFRVFARFAIPKVSKTFSNFKKIEGKLRGDG